MNPLTYSLALGLLLAMPGPTNTMLALAGARRRFGGAIPRLGAVVAGYLTSVLPLSTLAAPCLKAHPLAGSFVSLGTAGWVLWLAARLWSAGRGQTGEADGQTATSLYVTTVLNPKGLVIALALIPSLRDTPLTVALALLSGVVLAVSALWLGLGATAIRRAENRHPVLVARTGAGVLLVFAASLAGRAAGLV